MLEEINKIGDINNVNDFFDFKISIKTMILVAMLWGICAAIFVVFIFGGINNTIDYATTVIDSTKKSIIINKDKKTNVKNDVVKTDAE